MTDSVTQLYEDGLKRYDAGEKPETLIPDFKKICDRSPKNASAWTSLSWLYLLAGKPNSAFKAAQKSVKLDSSAPQAKVNLAVAMLTLDKKGVRDHIESVQQIIGLDQEIRNNVFENIEDGLTRKPDWKELKRVKKWLET